MSSSHESEKFSDGSASSHRERPTEDLRRLREADDSEAPASPAPSPSRELPASSAGTSISEEAKPPTPSEMLPETGAAAVSERARMQWDTRLERVQERSPVEHHHLTEIDGRVLWVPNDYEQVKEHYFRQGGGKWKTVLGVETTTCVHSSTTIAAGIYLDPERRNPHYRSEDTILTAGMMAGAFDLELLQGGEEKSKSFVREASSLRKSFLNLRDMFHHLPATSPSHSVEMKGKDSSSPPHKIDKLFHEFDEIAQQEFDELASDMVNDYGFAPHQFLEALGLPISLMGPTTMEGLAAHYGKVVSVGVDAYVLWDDSSEHPVSFQQINHRVLSLGPAYDGSSGERAGLLFIDTGKNYENGAGVFKPNATCEKAISPKEWSFVIDQFRPDFQA